MQLVLNIRNRRFSCQKEQRLRFKHYFLSKCCVHNIRLQTIINVTIVITFSSIRTTSVLTRLSRIQTVRERMRFSIIGSATLLTCLVSTKNAIDGAVLVPFLLATIVRRQSGVVGQRCRRCGGPVIFFFRHPLGTLFVSFSSEIGNLQSEA